MKRRADSAGSLRHGLAAAVFLVAIAAAGVARAEKEKDPMSVTGAGWWDNRELERTLRLLRSEGAPLNANAVEDAAFILVSTLREDGYLRPRVHAAVTLADGAVREFSWDHTLTTLLPRPMAVKQVAWRVEPRERYTIDELEVEGLRRAMEVEEAREFFRNESLLLPLAGTRLYTPNSLSRSVSGLEGELHSRGFQDARVRADEVATDEATGDVRVHVTVDEGARWEVREIELVIDDEELREVVRTALGPAAGAPYSPGWRRDADQRVRGALHARGYAEAQIEFSARAGAEQAGARPVRVTARVTAGPKLRVGEVRFSGDPDVKDSVLRRRLRLREGEPLDPGRIEEARARLARLGVFRVVEAGQEPTGDPGVRDVVFTTESGPRQELSLLLGWGSYELLRGGLEWRRYNVLDRAHQMRLRLVQSFKASSGELVYSVPELFGETLLGTGKVFGLQREEVSFDRTEYGANVGVRRYVRAVGGELGVDYTWQRLRVDDVQPGAREFTGDEDAVAASLDFSYTRDRRDNPLRPRSGHRLFARLENAARALGGEVDYQRVEAGASWHHSIGGGRWVHLGLTHGVVFTLGADSDLGLPLNKRFFPGGQSSIRGFQEGEAAPRAPDGSFLGAKTYTLLNAEFEQALTPSWSAVIFADGLTAAARLGDYPGDEQLLSVGAGLRYQTIVGPIRLEYGHNVEKRADDPSGTLHFSVGFPF